jgi:hypothetical protein
MKLASVKNWGASEGCDDTTINDLIIVVGLIL